jgi:transaldolase
MALPASGTIHAPCTTTDGHVPVHCEVNGMTLLGSRDEEYFHRVAAHTPTEFWINNPTFSEAEAALQAGASGATTNPTYLPRLLKEEPAYVAGIIDEALIETDDADRAADLIYQKAVARLQRLFEPMYAQTRGRFGYVAIQGDPRLNTDPDAILEGALRYRELGDNVIIKVPSWPAGAVALEKLGHGDSDDCHLGLLGRSGILHGGGLPPGH